MNNTRRRMLDVPTVKAHDTEDRAKGALKFLARHKSSVTMTEAQIRQIRTTNSHSSSPIYEMYTRIANDEYTFNQNLFLNFKDVSESIPEILIFPHSSINAKELGMAVPDELNKAWVNITPVLGKTIDRDSIVITDIPELHSMVVRTFLSMTYYQNKVWLNPNLIAFIIESYSMAITKLLQQLYNLNPQEVVKVQIHVAYYYACLVSTDRVEQHNLQYPPILNRCGFLGSIPDILSTLEVTSKVLDGEPQSTKDLAKLIAACGIDRLKNLTGQQIYTTFARNGADSYVMLVATDYPPYWVYQLMRMASGYKNFLISNIFRMSSLKKGLDKFIDTLRTTNLTLER